jgi:unsaturated rhamnogalacturonyl hydrolase
MSSPGGRASTPADPGLPPAAGGASSSSESVLPGIALSGNAAAEHAGKNGAAPSAARPVGDGGATTPAGLVGLPPRADVLAVLRLANRQFANKWPDPTIDVVTDRVRPSNLHTRAVYYEGLMGLYAVETDAQRKAEYYDYAVRWAESPSHPWQVTNGDVTTINADSHACGQVYLELHAIEPSPVRIEQIEASIRNLVATGGGTAWWWIDAIQMAMPVVARLGVLRNDPALLEGMWGLYSHTRDTEGGGLFDAATGLWWRDANYTPDATYTRSPSGQGIYWSRGNGWVMAGLARVLEVLPTNEPHRASYEADFRQHAAAIVPLQRADGFWNSSLTIPDHCQSAGQPGEDGPETSGTALFAYGLGWGIRRGLLDPRVYGPVLVKAWNGLVDVAVRDDGFLGYVQSTGPAPCTSPGPLGADVAPNFEDLGLGCFLLAGSEVARLGL